MVLRSERPVALRSRPSGLLRSGNLHLDNLRLDNLRLGTSLYQPSDNLHLQPPLRLAGRRRRLRTLLLVLLLNSRNNRSLHLGSLHNHNLPLASHPGSVPSLTRALRQHRRLGGRSLLSPAKEPLRLGLVLQLSQGQSLVSQHSEGGTMPLLSVRQQHLRLHSASLPHQPSGTRLHNLHSVFLGLPRRQPSAKLLILPPRSRLHQHNQRLANHRSLCLLSDSRPLLHLQHNLNQH